MTIETKESLIAQCMQLISKTYMPGSLQYKNVKKGLSKLNNVELDSLYVMLLTSMK